ncbi:hypothetical protein AWQ22_09400 [Picosynechococcus sp. PCC 7117]|nr:hypothetical protein AWQ22_09400 [Picosynechococcus sp. PCC 7117]
MGSSLPIALANIANVSTAFNLTSVNRSVKIETKRNNGAIAYFPGSGPKFVKLKDVFNKHR